MAIVGLHRRASRRKQSLSLPAISVGPYFIPARDDRIYNAILWTVMTLQNPVKHDAKNYLTLKMALFENWKGVLILQKGITITL